jgi:hypothetical protein
MRTPAYPLAAQQVQREAKLADPKAKKANNKGNYSAPHMLGMSDNPTQCKNFQI